MVVRLHELVVRDSQFVIGHAFAEHHGLPRQSSSCSMKTAAYRRLAGVLSRFRGVLLREAGGLRTGAYQDIAG